MKNEIILVFQNNIFLINIIDKIIRSFRIQNYDNALRNSTTFIDQLNNNMDLLSKVTGPERIEILLNYLEAVMNAQSDRDYVLLADLYELQLLRFFLELQEDMINSGSIQITDTYYVKNLEAFNQCNPNLGMLIETGIAPKEILQKEYDIEFSSCGLLTLAITDDKGKYYLHSNSRISEAAFSLANSWYQEDTIDYVVYGLGLGYHIRELSELDSSITIEVYESDLNILKLAAAYTDMIYLIQNSNIKIVYDPDYTKLIKRISRLEDHGKFVIHYPSLRNIKNTEIKEKLENYFIQYSSIENQRRILNGNFRENIHNYDSMADELKDKFQGKDLYIVAAGPSLDKNYMQLKKVGENGIILATGTVFRKLINAGIIPDYIIVTDANSRVYGQIGGYEDSSVPMLFLSTAYKGFANNYKGRKYMICQKNYDKAEAFAKENNTMLFQSGGSVSTTALDIGITFGCRRIIFLGLDLAFTDNYVHASDTSLRDLASSDDLRQVKDIYGNSIYTSRSLDIYRHWIESRIRDVKGIELIDATEGGAKITGMKIMKLSDCICK